MPAPPELGRLAGAHGRPSSVELGSRAGPEAVIAAYADQRPIVLWGSWLGDEVIIGIDPLLEVGGLDAAACWAPLRVWPTLESPPPGIGGGWFVALGYDPGTSWLAFCDFVLRRRSDQTWVFDSLGLAGREAAATLALDRARAALNRADQDDHDHDRHDHDHDGVADGRPLARLGPLRPLSPGTAADDHLVGVERVIGRIRAGEVYQLNLCTRLGAELTGSPLDLFLRVAGALRPPYGALLPTTSRTSLVSLSPERFLTVAAGRVITSPIKGTTERAADPDGTRLRASAKDAAENVMITDLMRNDLSRVCAPGTVSVSGLLEVQPFPGVWHLVSTVTGSLAPGTSVADLLEASFPPGSVTGAPKSSAVRAIATDEPHPRGAYTGAAGLLTPDGRAELSVLIRTFEVSGQRAELGVGGGITVDSVPVLEWQECLHKAEPLARAAGSGLTPELLRTPPPVPTELAAAGVFESILVQRGRAVRLSDHLARLGRSVRELYHAELADNLAERALAAAASSSAPRAALRIVVRPGSDGIADEVTIRPLGPRLRSCTLALANRPAISWRHKWADRQLLAAAEASTAPALPYFVDDQGRVAETSRGNLFVLGADGVWRTPPSGDEQLPGVTRRALLDELGDRGVSTAVSPIGAVDLASAAAAVWTSTLSGVVCVHELDSRPLGIDGVAATWSPWLGIP